MGWRKSYSEYVMNNDQIVFPNNLICSCPKYGIIGNDQDLGKLGNGIDFPQPASYDERQCTNKASALRQRLQ